MPLPDRSISCSKKKTLRSQSRSMREVGLELGLCGRVNLQGLDWAGWPWTLLPESCLPERQVCWGTRLEL